jgi:hypothetical protein
LKYHGGTNFYFTSEGVFITTSYDYDAPIDEYGMALLVFIFIQWFKLKTILFLSIYLQFRLLRLPKWPHLRDTLLYGNIAFLSLGPKQQVKLTM